MKKLKVLSMVAAAAGMFSLTSCLDGNNTQSGAAFGVIDMISGGIANVAYVTNDLPIYSSQFSSLNIDQCILFSYSIDYGSEANKAGNKYVTAEVGEIQKISQIQVDPYLSDTAVFYANELTFNEIALTGVEVPVKNKLFIASVNPNSAKGQNSYDASYDINTSSKMDGRDVYNIVIRGYKGITTSSEQGAYIDYNALDVTTFLSMSAQKEKAAGNADVKYRFTYIKSFDKDTTSAVWVNSDVYTYTIPTSSSSN